MRQRHTRERLEPVIKESVTWAEVCRKLGLRALTGSQSHIHKCADRFGISYAHFVGQSSTKGKAPINKRPLEDYFEGKAFIKSHYLRIRLLREGYKQARCEGCYLTKWQDQAIPLELDHINGDNEDNRLENLRILCPNCHALTTTYCRRK